MIETAREGNPFATLHHVGIVVPDPDEAVEGLWSRYGIEIRLFAEQEYPCRIADRDESPVVRIGLSVAGPPHLEILREVPGSVIWTPVPGLHHLGYVVPDVPSEATRLEHRGAPIAMAGGTGDGAPAGQTYHRDPLGHLVELLDAATARRLAARLDGAGRGAG